MTTIQATIAQLGIPYLENEPMSRHTTFRIGGPAEVIALPRTPGEVKAVLDVNKAQRHIRGGIATRKKYRGT